MAFSPLFDEETYTYDHSPSYDISYSSHVTPNSHTHYYLQPDYHSTSSVQI